MTYARLGQKVAKGKSTLRRPVAGDSTRTKDSQGSAGVLGASSPATLWLGLKTPMLLGLPLLFEHRVPLRLLLDEVS